MHRPGSIQKKTQMVQNTKREKQISWWLCLSMVFVSMLHTNKHHSVPKSDQLSVLIRPQINRMTYQTLFFLSVLGTLVRCLVLEPANQIESDRFPFEPTGICRKIGLIFLKQATTFLLLVLAQSVFQQKTNLKGVIAQVVLCAGVKLFEKHLDARLKGYPFLPYYNWGPYTPLLDFCVLYTAVYQKIVDRHQAHDQYTGQEAGRASFECFKGLTCLMVEIKKLFESNKLRKLNKKWPVYRKGMLVYLAEINQMQLGKSFFIKLGGYDPFQKNQSLVKKTTQRLLYDLKNTQIWAVWLPWFIFEKSMLCCLLVVLAKAGTYLPVHRIKQVFARRQIDIIPFLEKALKAVTRFGFYFLYTKDFVGASLFGEPFSLFYSNFSFESARLIAYTLLFNRGIVFLSGQTVFLHKKLIACMTEPLLLLGLAGYVFWQESTFMRPKFTGVLPKIVASLSQRGLILHLITKTGAIKARWMIRVDRVLDLLVCLVLLKISLLFLDLNRVYFRPVEWYGALLELDSD